MDPRATGSWSERRTAPEWAPFRTVNSLEFAEFLQAAELARLAKYPLSHRGPKKPRPNQTSGKSNPHVATARLLDRKNRHNRLFGRGGRPRDLPPRPGGAGPGALARP